VEIKSSASTCRVRALYEVFDNESGVYVVKWIFTIRFCNVATRPGVKPRIPLNNIMQSVVMKASPVSKHVPPAMSSPAPPQG
jgi:hypothetical protein